MQRWKENASASVFFINSPSPLTSCNKPTAEGKVWNGKTHKKLKRTKHMLAGWLVAGRGGKRKARGNATAQWVTKCWIIKRNKGNGGGGPSYSFSNWNGNSLKYKFKLNGEWVEGRMGLCGPILLSDFFWRIIIKVDSSELLNVFCISSIFFCFFFSPLKLEEMKGESWLGRWRVVFAETSHPALDARPFNAWRIKEEAKKKKSFFRGIVQPTHIPSSANKRIFQSIHWSTDY